MTIKIPEFDIAVMMPTRARTDAFSRSIFSLLDHAGNLEKIQFLFAIDDDDTVGLNHFTEVIQPRLDSENITYTALSTKRLGYENLHTYYNMLAAAADANWLMVWCDDAIMETDNWDYRISECTGQFNLLKVHTHNEHPYSIFPIIPIEWYRTTGYFSRHQMVDAEVSQQAYLLDIMKIIEVNVTHDRVDLTGNNDDATQKNKTIFEGNPNNPLDFHHPSFVLRRNLDTDRLSEHMKSVGVDTSWWENIKAGKQDPWQRMIENDPNQQTARFDTAVAPSGKRVLVKVPDGSK